MPLPVARYHLSTPLITAWHTTEDDALWPHCSVGRPAISLWGSVDLETPQPPCLLHTAADLCRAQIPLTPCIHMHGILTAPHLLAPSLRSRATLSLSVRPAPVYYKEHAECMPSDPPPLRSPTLATASLACMCTSRVGLPSCPSSLAVRTVVGRLEHAVADRLPHAHLQPHVRHTTM